MILAFDTYYYKDKAKTVALQFHNWHDAVPYKLYSEITEGVEEYVPGEFYKRELPCILSLLKQIELTATEAIIVDGFVYLDDNDSPGLGAHLCAALNQAFPVIGVAKNNFATLEKNKLAVTRGESKSPLYVTAIGTDLQQAANNVQQMHGQYRIPTLLKELDMLTRKF